MEVFVIFFIGNIERGTVSMNDFVVLPTYMHFILFI